MRGLPQRTFRLRGWRELPWAMVSPLNPEDGRSGPPSFFCDPMLGFLKLRCPLGSTEVSLMAMCSVGMSLVRADTTGVQAGIGEELDKSVATMGTERIFAHIVARSLPHFRPMVQKADSLGLGTETVRCKAIPHWLMVCQLVQELDQDRVWRMHLFVLVDSGAIADPFDVDVQEYVAMRSSSVDQGAPVARRRGRPTTKEEVVGTRGLCARRRQRCGGAMARDGPEEPEGAPDLWRDPERRARALGDRRRCCRRERGHDSDGAGPGGRSRSRFLGCGRPRRQRA